MIKPGPKDLTHIRLANKSVIPRIGYVSITGTFIFPDEYPYQTPIRCEKIFEVMPCEHAFLLGTGMLPTLFPQDKIMKYLPSHSSITDKPTIFLTNANHREPDENLPSISSALSRIMLPSIMMMNPLTPFPLPKVQRTIRQKEDDKWYIDIDTVTTTSTNINNNNDNSSSSSSSSSSQDE